MHRCRLHILGASGSGTTTLGRVVADAWAVPHADSDDYFWHPTAPPFTTKRAVPERLALMEKMFVPREAWVLSGAMTGWGDPVIARCDAVVFLTLDPQVRLRRLEQREAVRHGEPDPEDRRWTDFREWARGYDDPDFTGRSRRNHEAWLETLDAPVLRLDSALSPTQLRDAVLEWAPS